MSAGRTAIRRRSRRVRNDPGNHAGRNIIMGVMGVLLLFSVAAAGVAGAGVIYAMGEYDAIADDVVPAEELIARFSRGGARIYDRHGELMYEFVDELSGLRRPIALSEISPWMLSATMSVEDPSFYENNGINVRGTFRAGVENFAPFLIGGEGFLEGSGGSSITQQLARNVYMEREEREERSIARKLKEMVIAVELTERYPKDQILEWYLNSISYGGIYTGIQAAAE
ncbi:MAG: glycosyl transferase, partial [Chloroflexi bacterium]|nr:glycosyl transferase [Chloroflexota bacterium]